MVTLLTDVTIDTSRHVMCLDDLPSHYIRRGFEAAMKASKESEWCSLRDKMGASLFAGSRLLCVGFNMLYKSKPSNRFTKVNSSGSVVEYTKSLHAEQSCLIKIKHMDYSRQKLSMFVYRENASGIISSSCPCPLCSKEIQEAKIDTIYFITVDRYLGVWKP